MYKYFATTVVKGLNSRLFFMLAFNIQAPQPQNSNAVLPEVVHEEKQVDTIDTPVDQPLMERVHGESDTPSDSSTDDEVSL